MDYSIKYCTNLDVLNMLPAPARESNSVDSEIEIWRPVAQAWLDDMFSDKYIVPLQGTHCILTTENIPQNVKYACALMTVSLLLTNVYTEYNYEETKEEKTITLAQNKEYSAKKMIAKFIDKKNGYFHPDLKQQVTGNIIPRALKVFNTRNNQSYQANQCFIDEVNNFYT